MDSLQRDFRMKGLSKKRVKQFFSKGLYCNGDFALLTLSPRSTTNVPYANSLDLDEMASNSPSHPDPSCLTLRQHFHKF